VRTNVSQAEIDALRSGASRPARSVDVALRDFAHPRTLSTKRLRHLSKSLSARLGTIANNLAGPLRNYHKLQLGEVAEVTAHGLFDGFVKPFIVLGFPCAGRLGWLVWDSAAAAAACDIVLSGPAPQAVEGESPAERDDASSEAPVKALSRTESCVVSSLLDAIVAQLAEALNLEVQRGEIWQEPEELTTLEDLGPDADSRRLLVHLVFEGPGGTSEMRIYLPGVVAEDDDEGAAVNATAPPHLAGIGVRLSVELGATMVPLRELLQLEVGDVIPLHVHVGQQVGVRVEEQVRALARFGVLRGRMAVVIEQLTAGQDEELTPDD
jgi:flagellar motor switch protein FliM